MNAMTPVHDVRTEMLDFANAPALAELDAWIVAHPDSTPFHRPAWLAAVATGCGQTAHLIVARSAGGTIAGILPLTEVRSRLFGRAMVSSGFAVDGGILAHDPDCVALLAGEGWALARATDCTTMELRGGAIPTGDGWTVKTDAYLGFCAPLAADDASQLAGIPRKHRAEVRKALDNGLTFETGDSARLRDIHYRLYADSVHRLGTPVFPRALFDAVLDGMGDAADIALVSQDGEPQSAVLTLYHKGTVMPYWQGGTEGARKTRANELLYFRLMDHGRSRGMTAFDFGRSKVGTGPAAYKKNWGFEGAPLSYAVRVPDGQVARDVNPLSPQYRRKVELWKKLPLPLANLIGPMLSRGLG